MATNTGTALGWIGLGLLTARVDHHRFGMLFATTDRSDNLAQVDRMNGCASNSQLFRWQVARGDGKVHDFKWGDEKDERPNTAKWARATKKYPALRPKTAIHKKSH